MTKVFDGRAAGGKIKMPLTSQAWGTDEWLKDTFGVTSLIEHGEEAGPCATLCGC